MVGLINFYFSDGMLSLFVDTPNKPLSEVQPPTTFRGGFTNFQDIWDVSI